MANDVCYPGGSLSACKVSYNRIKWAAALHLWPLKCFLNCVCVSITVDSASLEGKHNTTHSDSSSVGGESVTLTTDRDKLQEMVPNNMSVTHTRLSYRAGHCIIKVSAWSTACSTVYKNWVKHNRKQMSFIHFSFHGFKGIIQQIYMEFF